MIAYNKILLENIAIEKKAKKWYANNLISDVQMSTILNKYPIDYFKPNIFIKVGLFIFTCLIISAALGIFSLIMTPLFVSLNSIAPAAILISVVFCSVCFFLLELFIRTRKWFSNGMDDALLYCGLGAIVSIFAFSLYDNLNGDDRLMIIYFLMLPVLFFAMMRYLDRIVAALFTICMYTVLFFVIEKMGDIAKLIMPFAFMALSVFIYFFVAKQLKKDSTIHLRKCLTIIRTIALIAFYLSGNYYVIRECSVEFFYMDLSAGQDIPFAFIFYLFTALVPLIYLYLALKNKDKLVLWVSLLLIAVAVLTFKYYFSLGHPEITLTLAGIIMICLSYFSIRYLKEDKKGLTFKTDPDEDDFLKSHAESLIIAQSFGSHVQVGDQSGVDVGDGKFGGAGSGGNY